MLRIEAFLLDRMQRLMQDYDSPTQTHEPERRRFHPNSPADTSLWSSDSCDLEPPEFLPVCNLPYALKPHTCA